MSTLVVLLPVVLSWLLVEVVASDSSELVAAVLVNASENFSACGGVYIQKRFTLKSENYPESYPGDLQCHYLIKGPHCPSYYKFEFLDFALENSVGCTKDRFVVQEQDALCGYQNKTKTYFASNGSLHVTFTSDGDGSGRGYLIRVNRTDCEKNSEGTSIETSEATTLKTASSTAPPIESRISLPDPNQSASHCCGTIYNAKTIIITSPNFPYTLNKKADCVFEIHKTDQNICRLRINFLFFYLGYTNVKNCPHGYLEVDGKYICGCNSESQLVTAFGNANKKVIRFKTEGYYQGYNSGFVLEVIQDECPKKYSPSHYHNDEINKVAWPAGADDKNLVEKLHLINERTEVLDTDEVFYPRKSSGKIIKSVYFYAAPEYSNSDKEKTTFQDTGSIKSVLTNTDYYRCYNWNLVQYDFLNRRYGSSLTCPREEENTLSGLDSSRCVELSFIEGYFKSPGYPWSYPANLNICYRLRKQPGYCAMRIFVQDFQIEDSYNCAKDYLLFSNGARQCGSGLHGASWKIDLRSKDHDDMIFVTDEYYCARGFSGVYQQIACEDEFPVYPVDTATTPIILTTPDYYCDRIIAEKSFSFEVDGDRRICNFRIRKDDKDTCKINFYLEKFDLVCGIESLVIDGTTYCGHLSGKVVKVNVNTSPVDVVYTSTLENKYDKLRFKIIGEQISNDCLFVDTPDVQRLLSVEPKTVPASLNSIENLPKDKYFIAFVNKQFKDICGIVTNPKSKKKVPYETRKLAFELTGEKILEEEIEELEIHEIDCDNLAL
ncbi:hypothetical protein NQ315_005474 [Exocentrus adspersus]|uniref:CUB domain-containing protein n=1 Tax=Exocentrus adspersus TaxID=1586481 RepID=A0AAV8VSY7_9CUCU|nr:hypothetical protein NQ315_005474 [Exocentrus adspersus]